MTAPRIAVVTIAAGRHDHLRAQREQLALSALPAELHVVVAMGDPRIAGVVEASGTTAHDIVTVGGGPPLPLAAARNRGALAALAAGADLLVFLDVDCLPDIGLLARYADATARLGGTAAVLAGPVAYLPPAPPGGYVLPVGDGARHGHPGRPVPRDGELVRCTEPLLFWSLSFAMTPATWSRIGGFDEAYAGYGGEDTDFAMRFDAAGVAMWWVGGAWAFHQHHESHDPPLDHVAEIVANATLFRRRWGFWPMEAWLIEFERRGLVRRTDGGGWAVT